MPPKKATTTNGDASEASGKFTWEGANDTKLLLLTQGRYVKPDEYDTLSSAFPGTTTGSIRNRISALRVKQRNLYESLGWDVPEGGAGHSAKKKEPVTPRKKRKWDVGLDDEKAGGAKKVKKEKVEVEDEGEDGEGVGVKEEQVEDEEV